MVPPATGCEPGREITNPYECVAAAQSLGVKVDIGWFPLHIRNCRYEDVSGSPVPHIYFNTNTTFPPARPHPSTAWAQAVCEMPGEFSPNTGYGTASLKELVVIHSVVETNMH